jgi:uncharacterized protein with von Willebrand factor type A (vWA) domain
MKTPGCDPLSIEEIVVRLSSELRKMGRRVGVEESIDAANALRLVGRSDSELFEAVIKATLIKDFYLSGKMNDRHQSRPEQVVYFGSQDQTMRKQIQPSDFSDTENNDLGKDTNLVKFGIYSPIGVEPKQKVLYISRAEEKQWSNRIDRFKASILTLQGYRFKKSNHGEINLRRTLQLELKKGGDSPSIFHSMKKISKANVVLLCDVSGSMSNSSRDLVNLCCALKRSIARSEIFLFSTKLKRITYFCAKYKPSELALRIPKIDIGFGGGTKIGHCLQEFNRLYGHLLTRKTTVIIFSDGWDVGDITILKREMKQIHERANSVVWINPFLDQKEYSVQTVGMKTALEYVDHFISPSSLLER